jgi:pyruvate/2-oxoglutarate dehydrogenase complex dihydrolipoamide acyltransferase (E2) component
LIAFEATGSQGKMLSTLKMPKVGDAVDEVVVKEIKVKPGARVSKGDMLFVVETDKAQVEVPAPAAGVISNILIAVGDDVKTGAPTMVLDLG